VSRGIYCRRGMVEVRQGTLRWILLYSGECGSGRCRKTSYSCRLFSRGQLLSVGDKENGTGLQRGLYNALLAHQSDGGEIIFG